MIEVKRPVSVREAAVMTGVPAVAGEVKVVIETKTPPIVPKAALRKDEPVDSAPVATIPPKAGPGNLSMTTPGDDPK
jgi:hypothetical protein